MKLAAIYNIFDGHELLEKSILSIRSEVDYVIAVWQEVSNYGDFDKGVRERVQSLHDEGLIDRLLHFSPNKGAKPSRCETAKRQWGLDVAKKEGCTHFLHIDVDEFYKADEFAKAKATIEREDIKASACRIKVYYKEPTLSFKELDETYVPFIQEIQKGTKHKGGKYPVYADETRKTSYEGQFTTFSPSYILMHHMSWVRKDIRKKVSNSTAYPNLKRHGEKLFKEWEEAEEGSHIKCVFDDTLVRTDNIFGIEI